MKKLMIIGWPLSILFGFLAPYAFNAAIAGKLDMQPFTTSSIVGDIDVIAHRGASGYAPEHTLSAYKKAIQMKADYVELDLHMTKDGELVAIHDATLARTTNAEEAYPDRAPWRVKDFTLSEMKRLDAGSWFNDAYPEYAKKQYAKEKIPTLLGEYERPRDDYQIFGTFLMLFIVS